MKIRLTLILVFAAAGAQAEVHRCVEDGRTHFSDTSCGSASGTVPAARTTAAQSALAASSRPAAARSSLPWDGLSAGMTVEEVQRHIPGLTAGRGSHLRNGARALLHASTKLGGVAVEAEYYFIDGRLVQVNANAADSTDNAETLRNFERLVAAFRASYGAESERDIKDQRSGLSASARWPGGARMSITPITGQTSLLTSGLPLKP